MIEIDGKNWKGLVTAEAQQTLYVGNNTDIILEKMLSRQAGCEIPL